eukprot:SM000071S21117  [mRNA]  locus=s71:418656:420145:- [translate_table: standard]
MSAAVAALALAPGALSSRADAPRCPPTCAAHSAGGASSQWRRRPSSSAYHPRRLESATLRHSSRGSALARKQRRDLHDARSTRQAVACKSRLLVTHLDWPMTMCFFGLVCVDVFVLDLEGVLCDKSGHMYDSVKDALTSTTMPFYIVSNKPPSEASQLLREQAGLDIPADSPRIQSSDTATAKAASLRADPSNTLHYVDDDLAILEHVAAEPSLSKWQLYLASWGTKEVRSPSTTRIRSARLKVFPELLRWGLLMGVDDGCQEYEDGTLAA